MLPAVAFVLTSAVLASQATAGGVEVGGASQSPENRTSVTTSAQAWSFDEQEAVELAHVSTAVYCDGIEEAWDCGVSCAAVPDMSHVRTLRDESLDVHVLVGHLRGQCIVAFRGTDSAAGLVQTAKDSTLVELPGCSFQGASCHVGQGFLEQFNSVKSRLRDSLAGIGCDQSTPLVVTGHSLGGALTTMTLYDLSKSGYSFSRAYTFGQPRVGDSNFANAVQLALAGVPYYRITRGDDPFVPFPDRSGGFQHVGTEVFYQGGTSLDFRICGSYVEDASCSASLSPSQIFDLKLKGAAGHFLYPHTQKIGLMSAASCSAAASFPVIP